MSSCIAYSMHRAREEFFMLEIMIIFLTLYIKHIFWVLNRTISLGAQWLSGRVLDSRPKGRGFKPHRCHCVVVLKQDTSILA